MLLAMQSPKRDPALGAFRHVPYMGVIFVVAEAMKLGFTNGDPDWCNLGQGQPEVGEMEGAPPRLDHCTLLPEDHAYGPLEGTPELRQCIADHYNRIFDRRGSRCIRPEQVAVSQGGRLGLTRVFAALAPGNVGYRLPDYTAYEDLFNLSLGRIQPMPIRTKEEDGFELTSLDFETACRDLGLSAFILSNPCNPTGNVLAGERLASLLDIARRYEVTLILDEFYSHFLYTEEGAAADGPVSAASLMGDLETERVILIDGLTKSFRYPGWRLGWAIGPEAMIESIARTASAIDGGPSRIVQRMAVAALDSEQADRETRALREGFAKKRNVMIERLEGMGIRFAKRPMSTFYGWASLEALAAPFDDAMEFFRRALQEKVLTVPGEFFDVNPGKYRRGSSPYRQWMRFSFGPPMDNLVLGLDRLEAMLTRGA